MPTSTALVRMPLFCKNQRVKFIGGVGVVRKFQHEFGAWDYFVEMEMGQYPNFGRVGAETTVILSEADLRAL